MRMFKGRIRVVYVNASGEANERVTNKYLCTNTIEDAVHYWASRYTLDRIIEVEDITN